MARVRVFGLELGLWLGLGLKSKVWSEVIVRVVDWVMGEVEYFVSYLYCPVTFRATETKAQSRISAGSYSSTCPFFLSFFFLCFSFLFFL